jgi:hypothetical protein
MATGQVHGLAAQQGFQNGHENRSGALRILALHSTA